MADAEVIFFSTPACPVCRRAENALRERGIKYRLLDVSADQEALALLLRYAGHPTVPAIVAYGEVMVGLDLARLDQMLKGLDDRAEAYTRADAEEEEQLRESEAIVRAAIAEREPTSDDESDISGSEN